jgi:tetratricopeptide (TPR) repeat protein
MKLIFVILLSLLTVTAFSQKKKSAPVDPAVAAFNQELKSALQLASSEQYENAEKAFAELLKKKPGNGDIYYYYGSTIIDDYLSDTLSSSLKDMASQAESLFRKGIQQDSSNVLNDVGLGATILMLSSDTTAADKYFNKAELSIPIKKKLKTPVHAQILKELGVSQLLGKVNRYNKAINYLTAAKEIDPNNASIFLALGDVYIQQNDATNALGSYKMALYLDPTSPLPKIKIGNIYMRVPNLNAARPYFDEAREIDSTFAPVYRELGELYTMAGQYNLSKANFRKFLELSGNNIPAKIQFAKALFRTKDYTTALEILEEILKVDNSRNYLNRLTAYCCYDKKPPELEKGKTYIEEFFKNTNPESVIPRDYIYYGRILYKLAKSDSALLVQAFDKFDIAYKMDPTDLNLLSEVSSYAYYSHLYKETIKWLKLKNSKGKVDKDDQMIIGKSYYQLTDFKGADSAFNKVIETQPENIQAYVYIARSNSGMDPNCELGLAEPKFLKVIEKIGTDSLNYLNELQEAYTFLGYNSLQKKNYQESKSWYKRLYNLDPTNKPWQLRSLHSQIIVAYKEKNYPAARDLYYQMKKLDPADPEPDKQIKELTRAIESKKIIDEINNMEQ